MRYKEILIGLLMATGCGCLQTYALPTDFYPLASRLNTGKWVKVNVGETGIYEITYEELAAMGFSDPSKVGVFGNGGSMLGDHFTDADDQIKVYPDLEPIAVYDTGRSILFYGQGLEEIVPQVNKGSLFSPAYHYSRVSRSCYVNEGTYLLSDSSRLDMSVSESDAIESVTQLTSGVDYWYHEKDLSWNVTNTGRVFLGEDMRYSTNPVLTVPYSTPLAVVNSRVHLEIDTYSHPNYGDVRVFSGLEGNSGVTPGFSATEGVILPASLRYDGMTLYKREGLVSLKNDCSTVSSNFFNLDFILFSYQKSLPSASLPGSDFERYLFPQLAKSKSGYFKIPQKDSRMVFNITDRHKPIVICPEIEQDGDNATYALMATNDATEILLVDTATALLKVSNPREVSNSNVHSQAAQGADLLVITTPTMRPYAERLVALHKEHDGISGMVVNVADLYNEYSGGAPDPMAYRSFVRNVYEQGVVKPKNVLLFGPMYADARGFNASHDYDEMIIAWQDPTSQLTVSSGSFNANEWIGIMQDYSDSKTYQRELHLGVGVLPCLSTNDAEIMLAKIEKYMLEDTFAYRVNKYVSAGGIGDTNMHATAAIQVNQYYNKLKLNSIIVNHVIANSYESETQSARRFIEAFDGSPLMSCFFGHGSPKAFGSILQTNHVGQLSNENHTFMIFAGCTLGCSDKGTKGIGEHMIFSTENGLIGGLVPSRNSLATANKNLIYRFNEAAFCINPGSNPVTRHADPGTIGDIVRRAKNAGKIEIEGAYQLVCDPALRIPFPVLDVRPDVETVAAAAGDKVTVSGQIMEPGRIARPDFNGEIVARVMAPAYSATTLNKICNEDGKTIDVTHSDRTLTMAAAKVKDGKFSVTLDVPSSAYDTRADSTFIMLSAFDPEVRIGAAGRVVIKLDRKSTAEAERQDEVAPVIERFVYNARKNALEVTVSDDVALDLSEGEHSTAFVLSVDRLNQPQSANALKILDYDAPRYTKTIPLDKLSSSEHVAEIAVRDAAGNITTAQLVFTTVEVGRPVLTADASAVTKDIVLRIQTEDGAESKVVVTDAAGVHRATMNVKNDTFRWDGSDENGEKLSVGTYTLTAIDTSGRHSEPLRIIVL